MLLEHYQDIGTNHLYCKYVFSFEKQMNLHINSYKSPPLNIDNKALYNFWPIFLLISFAD